MWCAWLTSVHGWILWLLVLVLVVVNVEGVCPLGWFGRNCTVECRCVGGAACEPDGVCVDNASCLTPYFGPGCQFYDLSRNSTPNNLFLTDGNDSSCNPDTQANYLDIAMAVSKYQHLPTWFRVVVGSSAGLQNVTFILNNGPCINERRLPSSETSVDIVCDNLGSASKLQLNGSAAGDVCSIYISSACPPGTFGANCTLQCPDECRRMCEYVTGDCISGDSDGAGSRLDCRRDCPQHCQDTCDPVAQSCNCEAIPGDQSLGVCQRGKYGRRCNKSCSPLCKDNDCEHISGNCKACKDSTNPPRCAASTQELTQDSNHLVVQWIIFFVCLILVGLFFVAACAKRTKRCSSLESIEDTGE